MLVTPPGAALDGDVVVAGANEAMGDGDVLRAVAGIDAVGVAGQPLRRIDLQSPDRKAVAVVVDDVEVRRVFQRDAIEREVVGIIGDQDARNLLTASGARLLGQIPPGVFGAEHFFAAAAVDDAIAHDACADDAIGGDQRHAAVAGFADRPASRGRVEACGVAPVLIVGRKHRALIEPRILVNGRIARAKERDVYVDDERNAAAEIERSAEEGVRGLLRAQQHPMILAAVVDRLLNAGGIQLGFIGFSQRMAAGLQLGIERGADCRHRRLDDSSRILRGKEGTQTERQNAD